MVAHLSSRRECTAALLLLILGSLLHDGLVVKAFTITPDHMVRLRAKLVTLGVASLEVATEAVADKAVKKPLPAKEEKVTKEAQELLDVIDGKRGNYELVIAQTAPSVRVALPEEFGLPPGALSPGILVSSLKAIGCNFVLDTNTAADLTICEEGTELMHKIHDKLENPDTADTMPLFTSCCPGWMKLAESEPEIAKYISTSKSPHMMYGAMIKEYSQDMFGLPADKIYVCSVMPCVRKRGESDKQCFEQNGIRNVDNVITTHDLGIIMRKKGIDARDLEEVAFDSPFQNNQDPIDGTGSGAGQLFGASGGVTEAAVRTIYEVVMGEPMPRLEFDAVRGLDGVKETTVPLHNDETGKGLPIDLKIAVVHGLGEAKKLIKKLKDKEVQYDFVEVMACPGGCIGGGGQPKSVDSGILEKRLEVTYQIDRSLPRRRSHLNPTVQAFYDKYLGSYGSEKAHHLLHVEPVYGGGK